MRWTCQAPAWFAPRGPGLVNSPPGPGYAGFVQHRLGPAHATRESVCQDHARALQADRRLLKRQVGRDNRPARGDVCLQKDVARPIQGVDGPEVFQSQPPETDEHPRHVVARFATAIGVPGRPSPCGSSNQEDLTAGYMPWPAHMSMSPSPSAGGVQASNTPPRLCRQRPAEIGEAPPAPLQKLS